MGNTQQLKLKLKPTGAKLIVWTFHFAYVTFHGSVSYLMIRIHVMKYLRRFQLTYTWLIGGKNFLSFL